MSGACLGLPWGVPLVELIGPCSNKAWILSLGMLVLEPLGTDSGAGQSQVLPVTVSGLPVWSYKAVHCLWLPLVGLVMCRTGQTVHQGWLPQH